MRSVRVLWVMACLIAWAGPVHGETKNPFRHLFPIPSAMPADRPGLMVGAPDLRGDLAGLRPRDGGLPAQQPRATPPPESRTGLGALLYRTAGDFRAFPLRRSTWVILGIGAGAAALAHPADDSLNSHIVGSRAVGRFFAPGKYIGSFYVQLGTATGLYVLGRYVLPPDEGEPHTSKMSHLGFDLVRALIVSQALTQGTKLIVRRDRPTGGCCAFPSGHASAAFATASVLERHLGYRGAWPTFVIASYVAASRLHDNRHFLSDVVFGSALGIASGWTVVGRHGRSDYTMLPIPTRGGMMIVFSGQPWSGVTRSRSFRPS
jgi:membrane-associated phospholipid phosphatase